ncbi:MAG: helix-turn-helix transcriptional regulator [Clostridia bacterium]|nr:helix-turn-helix transcriptional regulator [Clostridia bacterium]
MSFENRLKDLRQSKNLTQRDLAETIYVSRSAVAKWENGLGLPSDANLQALCDFFGVEENWLLDRNDLKKEIKANKLQIKNIVISVLGIVFPIIFVLLLHIPFYNHYYKPGYVYPLVYWYYPPHSIVDLVSGIWIVAAYAVFAATFVFSILNVSVARLKKYPVRCFLVGLALVALSAIVFAYLFVSSYFTASFLDYKIF